MPRPGQFLGMTPILSYYRVITSHHPPDNIHLNILVTQDKLDVIMHQPAGQKKNVAAPTP